MAIADHTQRATAGERGRWWGAGLALAAAALFLATLSRQYSGDSCLYAAVAEASRPAMAAPHHLLLEPLAWMWFRAWRALGWTSEAMLPLQVLNALGGAACVGLLFWICVRAAGSVAAAVLAALGFAVCGGLWLLSTEAEFVTVPLAFELLVLGWILRGTGGEAPRPDRILAVGFAIGLCVLVYASTAALFPAAVLALSPDRRDPRSLARTALVLLAGIALPVVIGVVVAVGMRGPGGAVEAVLRPGHGFGTVSWQNLPRGAYAFLRTLVMFPGLGMNDRTLEWREHASTGVLIAFALTYLVTGLAVAATLGLAFARRPRVVGAGPLLLWAALHVVFAFWWVPSDFSFWLPATAAWWLLVGILATDHRGALPAVACAAGVLLLVNGLGLIQSHHRRPEPGTADPCAFIHAALGQRDEPVTASRRRDAPGPSGAGCRRLPTPRRPA